jgi:hypothetical protein
LARSKGARHVVQFPLDASKEDIREVSVRFEFLRQLYNATLSDLFKSLAALRADKDHIQALEARRLAKKNGTEAEVRAQTAILRELDVKHNFTESHTHRMVKKHVNACCFKRHLDSHTVQTIASRAFKSMNDYRFNKRGRPRFKSWRDAIHSADGKSQACLRVIAGDDTNPTRFEWNGNGIKKLSMPLVLDRNDKSGYQAAALSLIGEKAWKYCRVIKKTIRGKERLFVQLVMNGTAFIKAKHREAWKRGKGQKVGLDIGPSTIAAVSKASALLQTICPKIDELNKDINRLQKQNSRRLRLLNPDNFKEQSKRRGRRMTTTYKVIKGKRFSRVSRNYINTKHQIAELHRKLAACRSQAHDELSVQLVSMGNTVLTETISYKAWQKMFGRSVGHYAPSQLISKTKHKAEKAGGELIEINTWTAKLSQYDHVLNEYQKKALSERVHWVGGETPIQRDLYSAFLALCINKDCTSVSRRSASALFNAKIRHNLEQAVVQVKSSASTVALPQSLGIIEFSKLSSAQLEQYA